MASTADSVSTQNSRCLSGVNSAEARMMMERPRESERRKEDLRQFLREKWQSIRDLESIADSEGSFPFPDPSQIKGFSSSSRREQRESSVEYDPENPFDDDKGRGSQAAATPIKEGESLANKGESRRRQAESARSRDVAATTKIRTSSASSSRLNRIPLRSTSPVKQNRQAVVEVGKSNLETPSSKDRMSSQELKESRVEAPSRRRKSLKVLTANQLLTTCSSLEERDSITTVGECRLSECVSEEKSFEKSPNQPPKEREMKVTTVSPANRRRRRSEIQHSQTSAPPLDLSPETTYALAELEASLARLKIKHNPSSKSKKGRPSASKVGPPDELPSSRSSRSSPAEKLQQEECTFERDVDTPKVSFLQRVERAKAASSPVKRSEKGAESACERRLSRKSLSPKRQVLPVGVETSRTPTASFLHRIEMARSPTKADLTTGPRANVQSTEGSSCKPTLTEKEVSVMSKDGREIRLRRTSSDRVGHSREVSEDEVAPTDEKVKKKHSQANVLLGLRVLVDIRDQDGEDASQSWIIQLKQAGAKVYTKVPSSQSSGGGSPRHTLTHIVYKNGKPSTLHYLRTLQETQSTRKLPTIVGVNWIVQCVERGMKVNERDFLVEIGKQAILQRVRKTKHEVADGGVNKHQTDLCVDIPDQRRTSSTPKKAPGLLMKGNEHIALSELLAKKKTMQHAPSQPSPLARRCWNMSASTSSSFSTATN
ncbi:hypothetical protein CBS101457_003588 [Exobasidium rhododendri]|nr:hypothetical protein CBS101457_003588 [Exobasidium rhododendri]